MTFDYLILAGGRLPHPKDAKKFLKLSKNIVTVDRGAELALKLKVKPLLHVGDGDSFSFSKLKKLNAQSVLRLPQRKSISDLEYTFDHLDSKKVKLVLGAQGDSEGRSDHGFLNLILLSQRKNIFFADKKTWATRLRSHREFSFSAPLNTLFSVVPISGVNKISITGAAYNMKGSTFIYTTQGLSNVTRKKWTRIKSSGPALLFVLSDITQTTIDDSLLM